LEEFASYAEREWWRRQWIELELEQSRQKGWRRRRSTWARRDGVPSQIIGSGTIVYSPIS
jgi:hypothetical protein